MSSRKGAAATVSSPGSLDGHRTRQHLSTAESRDGTGGWRGFGQLNLAEQSDGLSYENATSRPGGMSLSAETLPCPGEQAHQPRALRQGEGARLQAGPCALSAVAPTGLKSSQASSPPLSPHPGWAGTSGGAGGLCSVSVCTEQRHGQFPEDLSVVLTATLWGAATIPPTS